MKSRICAKFIFGNANLLTFTVIPVCSVILKYIPITCCFVLGYRQIIFP